MVARCPSNPPIAMQTMHLSRRETEMLGLSAQGFSNKMIADILGAGGQTAKNHVISILCKLEASNRAQAALLALRHNLIEPQDVEAESEPALSVTIRGEGRR